MSDSQLHQSQTVKEEVRRVKEGGSPPQNPPAAENHSVFHDFQMGAFFFLWKESKWLKNKSHECSACFIIRRHTAEHLHKQRQRCRPAEERFTCTRHRGPEWVQISGFLLDLGLYTFAFESRTGSTNNEKPTEVVENGCKLRRPPT